ncbi:UDP-N-acetylglucosamine 4,6-dehydratase (inverting) [Haliovirga abyssi]|uniref:UDP-N-acetylglucosamine 4,6-dehydratase (Inverting) n=2 Tax=Haliovirga abyssi TaxID=2996794 RepID=A0AAU9DZX9_9FUSO|nr:UDP-N-acetylglucosamine 4,6-dehydratase (inverting) [Haliovirga abyssi]
MLNNAKILITGGTGSFGKKFIEAIFNKYNPDKVVILSRDEYKQFMVRQMFEKKLTKKQFSKLRFFIGNVRDRERLYRAFKGIDYVIHAAAMKQVPACEYNPKEAIKTNINGAMNIIDAALDCGVKKVIALSTDKAVNPINLYGGTKLVSDKLFIAANSYKGEKGTVFSVVRYGNVAGSRGSVIPFFQKLIDNGATELPVTDIRMTRFWMTLEKASELVFKALDESKGGETFVFKNESFKITELVKAMLPSGKIKEVGIRTGEKLHERMITSDDSRMTYEYGDYYIIYPDFEWWNFEEYFLPGGKLIEQGWEYNSGDNSEWLDAKDLKKALDEIEIGY